MATILALETSGPACSVAVSVNGEVEQIIETSPRQHAQKILPIVDSLLESTGLSLEDIDAIAYARGPGSFTGLRIGFGIVQGLAFGAGIPVIGVSTLEAMARKVVSEYGPQEGYIVPALDARMNEVYTAVYTAGEDGGLLHKQSDCAVSIADVDTVLPENIAFGVGDGWHLLNGNDINVIHLYPDFVLDANAVVSVADPLFAQGLYQPVEKAELAYIRNEVSWKKRVRLREPGSR